VVADVGNVQARALAAGAEREILDVARPEAADADVPRAAAVARRHEKPGPRAVVDVVEPVAACGDRDAARLGHEPDVELAGRDRRRPALAEGRARVLRGGGGAADGRGCNRGRKDSG